MQTPLLEITFSDTPQVDREAGVIRGVKILGRTSRNHRVYSEAALNQAAYLYEGLAVNLDHPAPTQAGAGRAVAEGFGWLTSVGVRDGGVFGDLHFLRSHPQADMIAEAAERNPRRFGLSHNAVGQVRHRDGQCVVEAIDKVHSVDIVQNPATSSGLFEAENLMPHLSESQLVFPSNNLPAGADITAAQSASTPSGHTPSDTPSGPVTLRDLCEQVQWGPLLEHPLLAVMRSRTLAPPADPADIRDTIASSVVYALAESSGQYHAHEFGDLFAHLARHLTPPVARATPELAGLSESNVSGLPVENPDATGAGTNGGRETSRGLAERVAQLETESACRSLLEELNRTADRPRLTALASLATEADRRRLIASWPARETHPRPRPATSPPLTSRSDPLDHLPTDLRGFVAALR